MHGHTFALCAFRRILFLFCFGFFFVSRLLNVLRLVFSQHGFVPDPHLPQTLLRCHDKAHPPLQRFIKHLAKAAAWKGMGELNLPESRATL